MGSTPTLLDWAEASSPWCHIAVGGFGLGEVSGLVLGSERETRLCGELKVKGFQGSLRRSA